MTNPFVMRAILAFCRGQRFASTEPIVAAFPELTSSGVEQALEQAIGEGRLAGRIRRIPCRDGQAFRITDIRGQ